MHGLYSVAIGAEGSVKGYGLLRNDVTYTVYHKQSISLSWGKLCSLSSLPVYRLRSPKSSKLQLKRKNLSELSFNRNGVAGAEPPQVSIFQNENGITCYTINKNGARMDYRTILKQY